MREQTRRKHIISAPMYCRSSGGWKFYGYNILPPARQLSNDAASMPGHHRGLRSISLDVSVQKALLAAMIMPA
jgi:hypothetical protein